MKTIDVGKLHFYLAYTRNAHHQWYYAEATANSDRRFGGRHVTFHGLPG